MNARALLELPFLRAEDFDEDFEDFFLLPSESSSLLFFFFFSHRGKSAM
jgi:hypothetical protein